MLIINQIINIFTDFKYLIFIICLTLSALCIAQNKTIIKEVKTGQFSINELTTSDAVLIKGLKEAIRSGTLYFDFITTNNAFIIDISKKKEDANVKIMPIFVENDLSKLCTGYFNLDKIIFFVSKRSCHKEFKETGYCNIFDISEMVSFNDDGSQRSIMVRRAPIYFFFYLDQNALIFKEKQILN